MSQNEEKAEAIITAIMPEFPMIRELMDRVKLLPVDLVRILYLIENIQKVSKYGKITVTVKNGEVNTINGENTFVTETELLRNLKMYRNNQV